MILMMMKLISPDSGGWWIVESTTDINSTSSKPFNPKSFHLRHLFWLSALETPQKRPHRDCFAGCIFCPTFIWSLLILVAQLMHQNMQVFGCINADMNGIKQTTRLSVNKLSWEPLSCWGSYINDLWIITVSARLVTKLLLSGSSGEELTTPLSI